MLKVVLGILTGILIFIAAGILATYWVGKMRREMEQKRPRVAMTVRRGGTLLYFLREGQVHRLNQNRLEGLACQELLLVVHAFLPGGEA